MIRNSMRRAGLALALALGLAACEQAPDAVGPEGAVLGPAAPASADARIGPGVLEAVRAGGSATVVVAFDVPAARPRASGSGDGGAEVARLVRAVASAGDAVLADAGSGDLIVTRRYAAVPALVATARSEAALRRLASDARVRRIDLDAGGTGALAGSVPLIGADRRHRAGNRGDGVVVAVFDTGIDAVHPDLADAVVAEACFGRRSAITPGVGFCPDGTDRQTGPGAAVDNAGHGTHVSGIVASEGTVSAPGVAPGAKIVAVKVLDNCSFAGCFAQFSEIVAAMDYVIANNASLGVQVINMSLGTSALFAGACDNTTAFNMAGAAAVNTLRAIGVLTVASSANNGSGTGMSSPACLSNVISVGATDRQDNAAPFANSNATTDVFAPGVAIRSLARGGGTLVASGTSMAAPHVAGCAALVLQAGDATTPDAVEARLKASGVRVTDPKNGLSFPRLDCAPRTAAAVAVTSLTLYDADRGIPIAGFDPIPDGATIDLAALPTRNLNVAANTSPGTVGSVRFAYDDNANQRTESVAPYFLAGDDGRFTPAAGSHTIAATPYAESDAAGAPGEPHTVRVTVVDGGSQAAEALLVDGNSGRCLDVLGESREPGAGLIVYDCHGGANQRFSYPAAGQTGEIRVYAGEGTPLCVDAWGAGTENGTRLVVWTCHGGANQQWTRTADGEFRGVQSGRCVDVLGARTENLTDVWLWDCFGGAPNQRWDARAPAGGATLAAAPLARPTLARR